MGLHAVWVEFGVVRQAGVHQVEERPEPRRIEEIGVEVHDLMAEGLEQCRGPLDGRQRLGDDLDSHGGQGVDRHPKTARVSADLVDERTVLGRWAPPGQRVGGADAVEDGGGVGHRPGHDPFGRQARPVGDGVGHPATARLEPNEPAARCRNPDRAAAVAGMGCWEHARGHRGRGTPARTTWGVPGVPGVAGSTEPEILSDADRTELWSVGPSGEDEARVDEGLDHEIVRRGGSIRGPVGPVGAGLAGHGG